LASAGPIEALDVALRQFKLKKRWLGKSMI